MNQRTYGRADAQSYLKSGNDMLLSLESRHAYAESPSFQPRLFVSRWDHLVGCLRVTHKALDKVIQIISIIQIIIIFNRWYWCKANRNGKSILCVADYNQLALGCSPVVWKTGTCWIDQRGRVRKRSVPFQSSFGINTNVCSLLLAQGTFPLEAVPQHTGVHTLQDMSVMK